MGQEIAQNVRIPDVYDVYFLPALRALDVHFLEKRLEVRPVFQFAVVLVEEAVAHRVFFRDFHLGRPELRLALADTQQAKTQACRQAQAPDRPSENKGKFDIHAAYFILYQVIMIHLTGEKS